MEHMFTDDDLEYRSTEGEEIRLETNEASYVYLTKRDVKALAHHYGLLVIEGV